MKKSISALLSLLFTASLMAGGDVSKDIPKVVPVPPPPHDAKNDTVYYEKDKDLLWQDQSYTDAEKGAFRRHQSVGKAGAYRYAVNYCEHLDYGGNVDWRLPTSDELTHVHSKVGQVFTYFTDGDFWSSTPTYEGKYYVVFPADAMRYARSPKQSNFIRCVRNITDED